MSRVVGRLCDTTLPPRLSRAVVNLYVKAYKVNLAECAQEDSYLSFDEFFTRKLKPGLRAICSAADSVASPADGRIESFGTIDLDKTLAIKKRRYHVAELIGDEGDAPRYAGGQFAVVYLSPRDYHRVHAPVSGDITLVRSCPGDLFPVNSIGERHIPALFATNRRVAIIIDNEVLGRVTVVMVGAIIVGRISVNVLGGPDVPLGEHVIAPPRSVEKGEEIGVFHLGSTAIVFIEPGRARRLAHPLGPVRVGESLMGDP